MRVIVSFLKNILNNYVALRYLLTQEREGKSTISFGKKIWCLFHGFSSAKYVLYNFKHNSHKLYLSDYQRRKTAKINGPYSLTINDKYLFGELFKDLTAKIFGRIKKGKIYFEGKESDVNDLLEFIANKKEIILKKYRGGGGKGIYKLSYVNENIYLDDQIIGKEKLTNFITELSDHLIMEHLSQLDYSSTIYPGTINSIRVLTMIDPVTNEPFITIAVHKFGSEKTKPADNVWKGGMTALIDLETGVLAKSAYHKENNNEIEWIPEHPDTKVKVEGTIVPNWNKVKEAVLEIARKHDYLKYVGWDVVVTLDGVKVIEGNNYSDVNILQIHQPLLQNERVKKFYKHYKIIK